MRKPLSFSLVALIAFFVVIGVILLFSFGGSTQQQSPILLTPVSNESAPQQETLDYSRVEINAENVQEIVAVMNRPSEYYMETKSETFYDNTSLVNLRRRWVKGGVSRIDLLSSSGTITMSSIYTGSKVYYWSPDNKDVLEMSRGAFTADEEQMIMDYSTLLALPPENIREAQLTRLNGEQCIYAEALNASGYVEKYWIATKTGLLLSGQTLKDDKIIFSVSTTDFDLTKPDDVEFTLPDKRVIK